MMEKYANPEEIIRVNPACLEYLAKMFVMDRAMVCKRVSDECGEAVSADDLFGRKVRLGHLSALAEVFGKHIGYFIFSSPPAEKQKGSILFRKRSLKRDLGYADRLLISKIEDEADRLASLSEDIGDSLDRMLKPRSKSHCAINTAYSVREEMKLRPLPYKNARNHLKYLVEVMGAHNIVVREHVPSSKDKGLLNLAGFFIKPQTLVIKREMSVSREIFTLAHELGHYLLDREDIDRHGFDEEILREEGWCNEFAFHFVLGEDGISRLAEITSRKNAGVLEEIIRFTAERHVSLRAVKRHLSTKGRASAFLCREIDQGIKNKADFKPNPISRSSRMISPLETEIFLDAWGSGLVKETELDERFGDAWVTANVYGNDWAHSAY